MTRLAESTATAASPPGATEEGPYDVFIAYARDDSKQFVVGLVRALEARGLNVYVDFDDIRAGAEDWRREIARGVELSHAFAFVVSPLSVQSSECSEELNLASGFGKRIVTILRCHPEEVDIVELDRRLRAPQWIPFPDEVVFARCIETLEKALAEDSEWIHKHTELLMLANR